MYKLPKKLQSFVALVFIFCCVQLQAQSNSSFMGWATIGTSVKIKEKWRISYSQLHSAKFTSNGYNFIQCSVGASFNPIKSLRLGLNYIPSFAIDNNPNNQVMYHRLRFGVRYYTRLHKHFRMYNGLHFEHHFTKRNKYQERLYFRNDFYYRNTKLPWRLCPFIEQRLYFYFNGKKLQYYNASGAKTEKKATNGLHAYRIKAGIKVYPIRKLSLSAYFLYQTEFNSGFLGNDLNSLNPNTNKIRRAFRHFGVFGISGSYNF